MTTQGGIAKGRGYAAFIECTAGDRWLPEVDSQLSAWLRRKGFDVDLAVSGDYEKPLAKLLVRRLGEGDSVDLLVELSEDAGNIGTWSTELLVHDEPGRKDWISLSIENDQGRYAKVPGLARYLMEVLPLRDGGIELTDHPQRFGVADVDRLVALLADRSRHGLVFVAGSAIDEGISFGSYANQVALWTRDVSGLGQAILLDPAATLAFEARVGTTLATPAWTIRTYQPGVEFSEALDSPRHRILGTKRLGTQSDAAICRLLGEVARQQAATRPIDPSLIRVRRRFSRLENRRLVDQLIAPLTARQDETRQPASSHADVVTAAPVLELTPAVLPDVEIPVEPDPSAALTEQLSLVQRVLGLREITEHALRDLLGRLSGRDAERSAVHALTGRVEQLQARVEKAEDENRSLLDALLEQQMETDVTQLDVDNLGARVRWLQTRLRDQGDFESVLLPPPTDFEESYPDTFEELLDRIERTPGVHFSGNVTEVERLNAVDTNGAALRGAWDCVLAMADYRRACEAQVSTLGLPYYLANPPDGYRVVPPRKFAGGESEATMNQFGHERIFAVPTHVHPTGRMTMTAHFRLAKIGLVTPRMYVYDAFPSEAVVYIGYIGRHLTTVHTN